ncbi:hypothetical protein GCM10009767_28520 [Kocuria aegyptia]|uniref:Uncharacterized protein n=1 Tax=Kocuria aegyptia TaxID=330943 RepID=A0ABN2L0E2_9MICC
MVKRVDASRADYDHVHLREVITWNQSAEVHATLDTTPLIKKRSCHLLVTKRRLPRWGL